ncbi:bile acid:Na+ symporter, BASS family [Thermodesulfobium acidiphilum]|uniref:Bile acid:Na+ symporter, BASS family n=1 Tax=Thermodesulfobium acidiphilum TaxID=1794699 RepID=A0A2R4W1Y5_THEAF|nr:bile acid:sodium symporter family protein [Thermodesulfobium acidiphilum]AWB10726.1 bile acid:Na+ symporter, BASS family [Thermodesulfobium acidiphilum]
MEFFERVSNWITKLFPLWVVIFAVVAFLFPEPFKPYGSWIPWLLGIIMLGMGLTLTLDDFKLVLTRPLDILLGVLIRYFVMPGVALSVALLLRLPPELAAGLILVGCCPSGTASNVMTFLSKGDTALSVTVSSVNTFLAPLLTPIIFLFLAGKFIPIDPGGLFIDILKIVLLPIAIGIMLRMTIPNFIKKIITIIPVISVVSIIAIIAIVVGLSAAKLATVALIAFVAVILHNSLGLSLGYWIARGARMPHYKAKAIAFEVGMENSALAVALAIAHLNPVAALPGAIFSVWHNLSGSTLAGYWGARDKNTKY